jgi:hypothetical protein
MQNEKCKMQNEEPAILIFHFPLNILHFAFLPCSVSSVTSVVQLLSFLYRAEAEAEVADARIGDLGLQLG